MLRQVTLTITILLVLHTGALGAIWPEEFFGYKRVSVEPIDPGNDPIWEEYGLEEAESVVYELNGSRFSAQAYRYNDATSAMAVFEWQRPKEAQPLDITALAVEWRDGMFLAHGNYIFRFDGYKPTEEQVVGMLLIVPLLEQSQLPTFTEFVPKDGRVVASERYVLGPASLEKFEPRIPPSVAGFHFGVEAQFVEYHSPKGDLKLGVFSYPTPHIARERLPEFRMIGGAVVKRTGSLLAVVLDPPDADEAEKLLGRVNYRATITWDEFSGTPQPNMAEILLTSFMFVGALLLAAVLLGVAFGSMRFLRFWKAGDSVDEVMIALHIQDK